MSDSADAAVPSSVALEAPPSPPEISSPVSADQDGWTITSHSAGSPTPTVAQLQDTLLEPSSPPPPSSDEAAEAPVGAAPPDRPPKLSGTERKAQLQAEINALVRQKHEADRSFAKVSEEVARLRASLPSAVQHDSGPSAPPAVTAPPSPTKPTWAAYEADGRSWDEFQDARDAWGLDQVRALALAAREETQALYEARLAADRTTAEQAGLVAAHRARVQAVEAEHPDFVETVTTALADVPQTPFMRDAVLRHPKGAELLYHLGQHPDEAQALSSLPLSYPMMDAVAESPDPIPLLSYFANHPSEATRLAQLPPRSALLALGALSHRLVEGVNTGSPSPAPPRSQAPPPIRPIGGVRGTGDASHEPADFDAWVTWANKRERAGGR